MAMWRAAQRTTTKGLHLEDAVERVRQGMKAMLRYGSSWHDVASQVGAITHLGLDPRRFMLVTDDSHAQTLSQEGHMDRVLRHAIEQGLDPITAIQMATINTAEHFGLAKEMGMIAPGRWADVVLVKDLNHFKADLVIAKGQVIAEKGEWKVSLPKSSYPDWATNSVHLKRKLKAEIFNKRSGGGEGREGGVQREVRIVEIVERGHPFPH